MARNSIGKLRMRSMDALMQAGLPWIFIISNLSPFAWRSGTHCSPSWIDATNEKWSYRSLFNELILHFARWNRPSSFEFHRAFSLRLNNSIENTAAIACGSWIGKKGTERERERGRVKEGRETCKFRSNYKHLPKIFRNDRGRSGPRMNIPGGIGSDYERS